MAAQSSSRIVHS